jgi:hypothetical protein
MLNFTEIVKKPKQFLGLTSLTVEEFDYLCTPFEAEWRKHTMYYTQKGKRRKVPQVVCSTTSTLPEIEDKLFFILYVLKTNSLQEAIAATYSMSQGKVSEWTTTLLPLLHEVLKRMRLTPSRDSHGLICKLEELEAKSIIIDGTERPIQRSLDYGVQEVFYSGKKKDHAVKNNIIGIETQLITYLSPTYEGSAHDKKICDEEEIAYPDEIELFQDTGFQGYNPRNVVIVQPEKKKKGQDLTTEQKQNNREISKKRVVVEHMISGVKRCRIVKDVIRNLKKIGYDIVMAVCCGLHNLRVKNPMRAYSHTHVHARDKIHFQT